MVYIHLGFNIIEIINYIFTITMFTVIINILIEMKIYLHYTKIPAYVTVGFQAESMPPELYFVSVTIATG